jgi:glutathione S-transferase
MSLVGDVGSFAATVIRLGRGLNAAAVTDDRRRAPERPLELYDFEACPYCRRVREVLTELDLDYLARPVAHGSSRREELRRLGGKVQAPFLCDPNTDVELYESADIMDYLNRTYGAGARAGWRVPVPGFVDVMGSAAATAVRWGRGATCRVTAPRDDARPLLLYNMEGSPYCRKVRETLCELDLVHLVRNVPKGSPRRAELRERGGKVQVPYLVDPNTQREMYESDDIVAYLEREYGPARAADARAAG